MKWLLAGALLAGAPGFLWAQERPPSLGAAAPAAAFTLDMEAPDEIRELLARHLELLRYRELTDLSDSELQRLLASAHKDTQDLLATLGYFSPDIRIDLQAAERSPGARLVTLRVQPGPATLVREVRIQLNGPIRDDPLPLTQGFEIETSWPLPPGRRFTQAGWNNAKQQALRLLTTQRFPLGQVSSSLADIDPDSQSARLTLTLDSGPAFQLGGVVVSGLQRYDAKLVTRLARLTPGADYEQTTLVAAQQRLSDSGYFDSVFVSLDTTGDPLAAPVRVQLRETPLKKLVLGLGASTDSGARLSVEHTHHQVPGIGWRAVSKLSLDRETRSLGTELTAPPDDSNWRWATSVQLQSQQLGSFDVESQRTITQKKRLDLVPASELVLSADAIARFRKNYIALFGASDRDDLLYQSVSEGRSPTSTIAASTPTTGTISVVIDETVALTRSLMMNHSQYAIAVPGTMWMNSAAITRMLNGSVGNCSPANRAPIAPHAAPTSSCQAVKTMRSPATGQRCR